MATYAQMIGPRTDHQLGRSQLSRNQYRGAANAWTVSASGPIEGIHVGQSGLLDPAVVCGATANAGLMKYVLLDRFNPPIVYDGRLLGISVKALSREGRPTMFLATMADPTEKTFLVKIETGNRHVAKSVAPQQVRIALGEPKLLISGRILSRKGFVASVEEFWMLKRGEALDIVFFDGSVKTLSFEKALTLTPNPTLRGTLAQEVEKEMLRKKLEPLEEIKQTFRLDDLQPDGLMRRNAGYHQLLDWAGKDRETWSVVEAFLRGRLSDIGPNVTERFARECLDPARGLAFGIDRKKAPSNLQLPKSAPPVEKKADTIVDHSLEKRRREERAKREASREARREADRLEGIERGKRARPGEAPNQYGRGKKGK